MSGAAQTKKFPKSPEELWGKQEQGQTLSDDAIISSAKGRFAVQEARKSGKKRKNEGVILREE